mgnify:CR=1 FL=1
MDPTFFVPETVHSLPIGMGMKPSSHLSAHLNEIMVIGTWPAGTALKPTLCVGKWCTGS